MIADFWINFTPKSFEICGYKRNFFFDSTSGRSIVDKAQN